jgi:single-stranded-DNA-specific exonuclease
MRTRFSESLEGFEVDTTRYYDLEIEASEIPAAVEQLKKYAPYGMGNPEPVFLVKNYTLTPGAQGFYKYIGETQSHLKLFNTFAGAIGFDMAEQYSQMKTPRHLEVYGTLSSNYFMGRVSNQIELLDMRALEMSSQQTPLAALLIKKATEKH